MSTLTADSALDVNRAQHRLRSYAGSALTRLRMQVALDALAVAVSVSAWMLPLFLFADKMFSLQLLGINVWTIWAALSLLGIPFLLWRTFAPGLNEQRAAILADERLGLHARLSSALTLNFSDAANGEFGDAFLSEAMGRMSAVRVQQAFPIRVPRAFAWLMVPAMGAAAIYYFMPRQDVLGIAAKAEAKRKAEERKQNAAEMMQGKLEDLKKDLAEKQGDDKGGTFKVNQLIKDAQNVAKELKDDKKTAEEALLSLGSLKKQAEDEKEKIQRGKEFSDRLEKLQAKDLNLDEADHTKAISEALKMGDAGLAAKEMRKLAQKVKQEILNDPKKSDEQKKKELEKLKDELAKLAGALAEDEALRDKLQEISETSMSAADYQKLETEMKKQAERQNKGKKKFGDDIEKEMEQAADELERLEEENDTKLSEDEKEEVKELDKVENSLDEAMENLTGEGEQKSKNGGEAQPGKQQGGDKTGKSGKPGAGNSGKLKSMRGRASQKGKGGNESNKNANSQSGDKGDGKQNGNPNGQPGNGLGAGQGVGRRPYQDGDATFEPQKDKGNMRAGAITGISHFRGQGAKGDAPQEFYQTFEPANKDGASSLELERIPADAKEMVKDYFTRVREGASPPQTPPAPKKADGPSKEGLKE